MFTAICYTFIDHAIARGTPILGCGNMLIAKIEKIPKRKLACGAKKGGLHVGYLLKRYHNSGSFPKFYSFLFLPYKSKLRYEFPTSFTIPTPASDVSIHLFVFYLIIKCSGM